MAKIRETNIDREEARHNKRPRAKKIDKYTTTDQITFVEIAHAKGLFLTDVRLIMSIEKEDICDYKEFGPNVNYYNLLINRTENKQLPLANTVLSFVSVESREKIYLKLLKSLKKENKINIVKIS